MSTDQQYQQIENYLTGRMSAGESILFEDQISGDPALKEEVEFQRNVIQGLKEYRKAQLKSSLSQVTVSPWSGFISSGIGKITSGVVVTSMVVGLVYLVSENIETTEAIEISSKTITVDSPKEFEVPSIRVEKDLINETTPESSTIVENEVPVNNITSPATVETNSEDDNEAVNTQIVAPQVTLPDNVEKIAEDDNFESEEISSELFETPVPGAVEKVDVNVKNTDSEVLRYKYFEGKLNLYGNFKDTTYQIIEVIGSDGKELYLFYKNAYYELKSNSEVQLLKEISDNDKVNQLEILKNHK